MSEAQLKAVMDLSALPAFSGLHPDDLASLARRVRWPREEEGPDDGEGKAEETDAVRFLLSGGAAAADGGPRFEAPALIGELEALAGAPPPVVLADERARIAWLGRADFRALLADVFELWLATLRHAMGRLLAAGPGSGEPRPGAPRSPDEGGDAGLVDRIRLLAGSELLADLRVYTLGRLAQGMEERRLAAGEALWEEGDAASRCFAVLEGRFARTSGGGSERSIETPRGTVLGLRGALADARRASRVVATDAAHLLCLPRERLIDELEDDPAAAEALLAAVARRALRAEARAGAAR